MPATIVSFYSDQSGVHKLLALKIKHLCEAESLFKDLCLSSSLICTLPHILLSSSF